MNELELTDYEQHYKNFWKDIVENPDGTLNKDQVMRELNDFSNILNEVPKVYCYITKNRVSKPNTLASAVISVYEDCQYEEIQDNYGECLSIVRRAAKNSCCICCDNCLACDATKILRELGELL